MDSWSAAISRREKIKKRERRFKLIFISISALLTSVPFVTALHQAMTHKEQNYTDAQAKLESSKPTWNFPTICLGNLCVSQSDQDWFNPSWTKTNSELQDFLMPWQLHAYGKLYHERDLMGRKL